MKAEQRKELETNILADKMGQVVQRVKTSPRRSVFVYFVIAAVVIVGAGLAYRYYRTTVEATADQWIRLDDGSRANVIGLFQKEGDTQAGKAAAFQIAWALYWDEGIKFLGADPRGALINLDKASGLYKKLQDDCKDDPIFEPQAMLGVAVCEEAKAVQDRGRLERAAGLYDALAKHEKYKNTAEGRYAQSRLDQLRDTKTGKIRAEVSNLYDDLQLRLRVPDIQAPGGRDPFPQLPFDPDLLKKDEK